MEKVIKTPVGETFKVGPSPSYRPSGGNCYYADGDIKDIPLVIGEEFNGAGVDLLKDLGVPKKGK